MEDRRYRLSNGVAINDVVFDDINFILESIDLGTVQEETSMLNKTVGDQYTNSRLTSREIDITCWCCNGPDVSYASVASNANVSVNKRKLQNVVTPFSESTLYIEEYFNSTWNVIYRIGVRLVSSIEWSTEFEESNPFAARAIMHLVAPYPFFEAVVADRDSYNVWIYKPYTEGLLEKVVIGDSSIAEATVNNVGSNPRLPAVFEIRNMSTLYYIDAVDIQLTNNTGLHTAKFRPVIPGTKFTWDLDKPIYYDSRTCMCTGTGAAFYVTNDSEDLYFTPGSNSFKVIPSYNGTAYGVYPTMTRGIDFLEV